MLLKIAKLLAESFPDDPSSPSVTVSWIRNRNKFYGSLIRYEKAFGDGKQVLAKAEGDDEDEVLIKLAGFLGLSPEDARGEVSE